MENQQDLLFDAPAFEVIKSYRDDNGQMFIEGLASTVSIDQTGERMSPEAIAKMAVGLIGKPLREEHQKGYLDKLGEIVKADVVQDDNGNPALWIKARLYDWSSKAKDTFQALKSGVKLGLSVAGKIKPGGLIKELVDHAGKFIPTYRDIEPTEVSVTDHPANLDTFCYAVAKSLNAQMESQQASDTGNQQDGQTAIRKDVANSHDAKPKEYADVDTSDFLDPDHYKYPVDERHLMPALRYFNHQGQREAGGYSAAAWEEMGRKLARLLSEHTGKDYAFDPDSEQVTPAAQETKKTDGEEVNTAMNQSTGLVTSKPNADLKRFLKEFGRDPDKEFHLQKSDDPQDGQPAVPAEPTAPAAPAEPAAPATGDAAADQAVAKAKAKADVSSSTDTSAGSSVESEIESLLSEIKSTISSMKSAAKAAPASSAASSSDSSDSDDSSMEAAVTSMQRALETMSQLMAKRKATPKGGPVASSDSSTSGNTTGSTASSADTTSTAKALGDIAGALTELKKSMAERDELLKSIAQNQPLQRKGYARVVEKQFDNDASGVQVDPDLVQKMARDTEIDFKALYEYRTLGKLPGKYAKSAN